MPRSPLRCTLAVLSCNVVKSRGVRGGMPGHRQFADPAIEEAHLRPRQTSYGLGCDRELPREKRSRGLVTSTSTSNRALASTALAAGRDKKPPTAKRANVTPHLTCYRFAHSAAQDAPGAAISRKRVRICLPAVWQK